MAATAGPSPKPAVSASVARRALCGAPCEAVGGGSPDEQARDQGQRVDQEQPGDDACAEPQFVAVDDEHRRELVSSPANREHRERDLDPAAGSGPGDNSGIDLAECRPSFSHTTYCSTAIT